MTDDRALRFKALREPFPESVIGKLPRTTCKKCSEAPGRVCSEHSKKRCAECGNYMTTAHIHLDYVGHAAATDRLLQVDPEWTWEPMAYNVDGSPVFTDGGLWIWLTVMGIRRPGFGDGASTKEIIGDAIRNAAMRFGVALDLWAKEDLHAEEEERKEGGLGPVTVPRSWVKLRELVEKSAGKPDIWDTFDAFLRALSYHLYGTAEYKTDITKEERSGKLFQKAAGAAVWIAENDDTPIGGSWSVEHIRQGFAHVLDGAVLEVPDLPEPEIEGQTAIDDEIERIADETIVGT